MLLQELFMTPRKNWEWTTKASDEWEGSFVVHNHEYRVAMRHTSFRAVITSVDQEFQAHVRNILEGRGDDIWAIYLSFIEKRRYPGSEEVRDYPQYELTGFGKRPEERGSQFTVYGTMLSMLREFVSEKRPKAMYLSAFENKQAPTYRQLIKRFAVDWKSYQFTTDDRLAYAWILWR